MLIRFIVYIIIIYFIYKLFKILKKSKLEKSNHDPFPSEKNAGEDLMEDPVCHTYVPVSQAFKREISGHDYYFCSKECSDKFVPEKNN